MSTEPSSLTNESPKDARAPSGVKADGTMIYICQKCLLHKDATQFDRNEYGRVKELCQDCERLTAAGVAVRKYMKDRSHITVESKTCKMCGQDRPSSEFWLDGKSKDGLKDVCGDCERRRRKYASAPPLPQYDSYTPASALQPVLDQAIAERDALVAEVESLQANLTEALRAQQNQAPRTDLLALNAIETELRWLRERLDQQPPADPPLARVGRQAISRAAAVVGPVAYRLFQWADRAVLKDE